MKYASTHQAATSAPRSAVRTQRDRHIVQTAQANAAAVIAVPTIRGFGTPAATAVEMRTIVAGRDRAPAQPSSDSRANEPAAQVTAHHRFVAVPDTRSCSANRWNARNMLGHVPAATNGRTQTSATADAPASAPAAARGCTRPERKSTSMPMTGRMKMACGFVSTAIAASAPERRGRPVAAVSRARVAGTAICASR